MIKPIGFLKGLGVAGGILAAGAAAGTALLLKKWASDPDSGDLRVVVANGKGVKLSKLEDGRVVVDTHYDAAADEALRSGEDEEPAGPVLVMDVPERVKEAAREAGADVKAAAELAADKANAAAGQLWEKSEGLRAKAEETAGQAREKAAILAEQMKEKACECREGIQAMANLAREQAESFFAAADKTAGEAGECCEKCAEQAGKDLEDLAQAAQDAAKEAADRIFPEE